MLNITDKTKIGVGQIWRKEGPYDWLRIERIQDKNYVDHDGGLQGVSITSFPPQLKGIQLRGGKKFFMAGSQTMTWQEQVKHNRFILKDGWKRGNNANDL